MAGAAPAAAASSAAGGSAASASFRHTYIVTAQPPTVVTQSIVCNFTSPSDTNLIVGRSTRMEIYRCTQDGLESMHEIDIYGTIASIVPFKSKTDTTHRLFLTTERHKFFVLKWDAETRELRTEAQGDSKLKIGRLTENSTIALIDPTNSYFGLQQYDGVLQMLAIESNGTLDKTIYDCRFDQLQVIQMEFLYKCAKPTVLVLSNETTANQDRRSLKSWTYESKEKEMKPAKDAINLDQCDLGASHIIPTVFGGALLLSEETVAYFPGAGKAPLYTRVSPWMPQATGVIDARRFLVGCLDGSLHVIILEDGSGGASGGAAALSSDPSDHSSNFTIKVEYLGQTSIAHRLTYIDNGFVLVGSLWGDSQLIQMTQDPVQSEEDEEMAESKESDAMDTSDGAAQAGSSGAKAPTRPSFIRVVNSFPNLGSILDMTPIDLDRSGQCQLVTCSGAYHDSSLRAIRNGIGISEEASIELEGIQGVWGVKEKASDEYHRYLVQTYASETRMLALEKDEETDEEALAECEIAGFDAAQRTLFVGNMGDKMLLQVTPSSCRLVDSASLQVVDEWKPSSGKIDVATANTQQLLVSSGKNVTLLTLQGTKFHLLHQTTLDQQIACMDVTPIGGAKQAAVAAICMWNDNTLRLYSLATLQELSRELLGDVVARSVLFTQFDSSSVSELDPSAPATFLMVGLGDGHLVSWEVQSTTGVPVLSARKRIALGTSTIELTSFRSRGELHVFVACDRPTVVSNAHGKLRYSNVNMKDLTHMTPFHAPVFKDCLALVSATELSIGHIDEIERLHIKRIDLEGGFGRGITHQTSTRTLAVLVHETEKIDLQSKTGEFATLRLYDSTNLRRLDTFKFERDEQPQTVVSRTVQINGAGASSAAPASSSSASSSSTEYFLVGTAYVDPQEYEPSVGRILIFQVDTTSSENPTLKLVSKTTIKSFAKTIDVIQGRLVCGIIGKVVIYRAVTSLETPVGEFRLEKECDYAGNSFVSAVRASKDGQYVMVLDMRQSMSILMFHAPTNSNGLQTAATAATLDEVARHYDSMWLTACESFSAHDDLLLTADQSRNLLTLKRNLDPSLSQEERQRLETVGKWHSGEQINVIVKGSLVMNLPNDSDASSAAAGGPAASSSAMDVSLFAGSDDRVIPTHLLGSTSGAILVAAPLSHSAYTFFAKLEAELENVVRGVGGLSHREWRQYQDERRVEDSQAVIDGDLIQLFLELSHKQQEQVAKAIGVKLQECVKRVEDCSRIH